MKALCFRFVTLAVALLAAGCGTREAGPPLAPKPAIVTPKSLSPALMKPAPMARTQVLPASAMLALTPRAARRPQMALRGPSWTQMSGAASQVLAAPDGSLWVLSTQPTASSDKYIWHYVNGQWTNISGLASELAVGADGSLYALNTGGGTYQYVPAFQSWNALGGGARRITVGYDGSVYVLSNAGSGPDYAIWRNQYGNWKQMPGSGIDLSASYDSGTYNATLGTVAPYGMYVLNHSGQIWYLNTDSSYALLSGTGAAVAPTTKSGVFVLGSPANSAGEPIYYYDLQNGGWTQYGGSGTSLSIYNSQWTSGSNMYVVSGSGGAIWTTPIESSGAAIRTTYTMAGAYDIQTLLSYGGTLWWSDGNVVNSASTSGTAGTPYTIPNNGGNVQMVAGPDGNLWLTQSTQSFCYSCQDYVVRMMLASNQGSMNYWTLPVASGVSGTHANPVSIASGSDGNLWIAEANQNANQIARVSTSGTVTDFPVATDAGSYPDDFVQSITSGPDGNVWFIITDEANGYDEIGKIAPSGSITRYHLPSAYSFSGTYNYYWNAIVAAPDGNLWFTEANGNRIGKISTSGVITEYSLPASTNPQNIGVGPDGNLWLRCECGTAVGAGLVKVTTSGIASGPYAMQNEQVLTLTAGPDKNLWFGSGTGTLVQVAI